MGVIHEAQFWMLELGFFVSFGTPDKTNDIVEKLLPSQFVFYS